VEVGELVMDHPLIPSLTQGVTRSEARPQRLPRQPRSAGPRRETPVVEPLAEEVSPAPAEPIEAKPEPSFNAVETATAVAKAEPDREPEAEPEPAAVAAQPGPEAADAAPFRWVTGIVTPGDTGETSAAAGPRVKAARTASKPAAIFRK